MKTFTVYKNDKEITVDDCDWFYLKGSVQLCGRYVVCNGVYLHRLILQPAAGDVVDHIDGSPLNNRRSNLRVCKQAQNAMNRKVANNSNSGVTGVSEYTRRGREHRWYAYIKVSGKQINLGTFVLFEDAVTARREAEIKYFGQFRHNLDQQR
jgi:hypothetical protein